MERQAHFRVAIPWEDVRAAIDLLRRSATASHQARPIGNRVVVDCAVLSDAQLLCSSFPNARLTRQPEA